MAGNKKGAFSEENTPWKVFQIKFEKLKLESYRKLNLAFTI